MLLTFTGNALMLLYLFKVLIFTKKIFNDVLIFTKKKFSDVCSEY